MKIAVSCDAVISRNHVTSIIESIFSVFEEAELYTIVHHQGKILGSIEQRKIHSTYLSSMIDEEKAFGDFWWKKAMLIPGATKNLTIPCSVDLLINISSGFSQNFDRCEGVYQITYLVENQFKIRKPKFWREKIFRGYLEHWALKGLKSSHELWVPNEKALKFWEGEHDNVSLLKPFIKATDFPLMPDGIRKGFPRDFFCIDAESLNKDQAFKLIENLKAANLKFRFVGEDSHLEEVKRESEDAMFFGNRCSGELAPLLSASRGFMSFQRVGFPSHCIESLSSGTPIWLPQESEGLDYVEGAGVFKSPEKDLNSEYLIKLFLEMNEVDPKKLHAHGNHYHDIKFRSEVSRRIEKLIPTLEKNKATC